jgi:outer membrane protein TolC
VLERQRMEVPAAAIDIAQVNQRRSDMQALRYRADAARSTARARRAVFLPTLNAMGGYQWDDENLFGTAGSSWTVGVALRWNLFSGFKHIGAAQRAQANLHRAELAVRDQALQNQVDIAAALRTLEATRQQVRQAEAAVEQARESLRIRSDRYAQDLEKTTDLLNAETTLATQRLAYLQALYQHNLTLYRLEWLTERALTP